MSPLVIHGRGCGLASLHGCSLGIADLSPIRVYSYIFNYFFSTLDQAEVSKLIHLALSFFVIYSFLLEVFKCRQCLL